MTGTYEQWDIVSSVGLTALVVAAGRAVEGHREDSLVHDPYAEAFVEAAAPPRPLPTRPGQATGDDAVDSWQVMSGYMGVRSRFFDEFFAAAGRDGIRQAVILAAGLDTRAYRLDWAPGTTVWEVDQPAVLGFKDEVLAREGATARADRRAVAVDLRDDWDAALDAAGFDRTAPSAWLAEGLLPYLPAEAEQALLETVAERAAPGSRIAVEDFTDVAAQLADPEFQRIQVHMGVDLSELLHTDDRADPGAWFAGRGWQVSTHRAGDVASEWGRPFDAVTARVQGRSQFVTAQLPA